MNYATTLWDYLIVSAPYLLFGLLISGVVKAFLSVDIIKNKLGKKNFKSVLFASAVGVPLPLCSCSVIPATVTLKKAGASNGATSSFLISTPESGIDSISVTFSLMDLPMTIIRPLVAFISAVIAGGLQNHFNDYEPEAVEAEASCCASKKASASLEKQTVIQRVMVGIKYAFTDLITDISVWLTIGLLAGAAINFFIPAGFFESLDGWTGRFVILAVGLPLYICASASTPVAASMVVKGLSPGSALIFLLVGPASNFSNIAVVQKYIGKKGMLINLAVIAVVALLASYLTDLYYLDRIVNWKINAHDHSSTSWWETLSAVLLCMLLIRGIYVDKIRRLF